ncbi:MAG: alanine acetyltransferase [Pseudoxanthomonas sp.]
MSELWSSQQHEWLSALGHTLYVPGSAVAPSRDVAAAPVSTSAEPSQPQREPAQPAPQVRRRPEPEATAAHVAPAPRRAASRLPDKLHFALIRASGCNPNGEDAAALFASWPPSSELRGNPAATRALWPQLRALRRQRAP